MPSPLGHALGGVAAGWGVSGVSRQRSLTVLYAALGALPDADLLVGLHSRYTHSVGAAVLVACIAAAVPTRVRRRLTGASRIVFALACAAAYASHILLDWLGSDTTAPIGIMALWPFSSAFYQSDLHWFGAISRRFWLPEFVRLNLLAAARELTLLGPVVLIVGVLRRPRPTTASGAPRQAV